MHDARMLAVSQLYDDLEGFAFNPAGREMCLYGDPAVPTQGSPSGTIPSWRFNKANGHF